MAQLLQYRMCRDMTCYTMFSNLKTTRSCRLSAGYQRIHAGYQHVHAGCPTSSWCGLGPSVRTVLMLTGETLCQNSTISLIIITCLVQCVHSLCCKLYSSPQVVRHQTSCLGCISDFSLTLVDDANLPGSWAFTEMWLPICEIIISLITPARHIALVL